MKKVLLTAGLFMAMCGGIYLLFTWPGQTFIASFGVVLLYVCYIVVDDFIKEHK